MLAKEYNGTSLAYLGDAVLSLFIRERMMASGMQHAKQMQQLSIRYVSAKAQAQILEALLNAQFFNDDEMDIVLRGRNSNTKSHAKNTNILTYRKASGLEAIIGYLYLSDKARLDELLSEIERIGDQL